MAAVTPENRTFDHASLLDQLDGWYADVRRVSDGSSEVTDDGPAGD